MNILDELYDTQRLNALSITGVAQRLGLTLKREGTVFKVICPWHDDTHASLTLYERSGENRCHCFSCGKGGSVIDLVMQHFGYSFKEACQWLSREYCIYPHRTIRLPPRPKAVKPEAERQPEYTYIPAKMLDELVTPDNSLCRCLMQMKQPEAVEWLTEEYRIGAYEMNGLEDYTVFPSIDCRGRVCNLKVQHYDTDALSPRFAHSDKSCMWLGKVWAREGRLPRDAVFSQKCLFGEHLLPRYPNSKVALVESPKNALFGALEFPEMTWVAAGNKSMFKRDVMLPLRGRDVIVIPDADAVDEWSAALGKMSDIANFVLSDFCLRMAPEGQPKFDIADFLQQ